MKQMFATRFDVLPPSPFPRLAQLLAPIEPEAEPIDLGIGEPKHAPPAFLKETLQNHFFEFNRYPPAAGQPELRQAIAKWAERRYGAGDIVDPDRHIIPLCGSREGLFNIALLCIPEPTDGLRSAVLMPNPFYQCYGVGAVAAGAEPVYLATPRQQGFLPDVQGLDEDLLARTAMLYFCSPANPQGAVAPIETLKEVILLAREHNFVVLFDECYSEIFLSAPPPGALDAVRELGGELDNVLIFNSLSKRSNLAGLRSGFCIGDADIIASFLKFRNLVAPQMPLPLQAVSAAAWNDEAHVVENRKLYQEKIKAAAEIMGEQFGFYAPEGGFFLWLDMSAYGGGETAAKRLWKKAGLRVVPGEYLARDPGTGRNENADFVRVALVHEKDLTITALSRMKQTMDEQVN